MGSKADVSDVRPILSARWVARQIPRWHFVSQARQKKAKRASFSIELRRHQAARASPSEPQLAATMAATAGCRSSGQFASAKRRQQKRPVHHRAFFQ